MDCYFLVWIGGIIEVFLNWGSFFSLFESFSVSYFFLGFKVGRGFGDCLCYGSYKFKCL